MTDNAKGVWLDAKHHKPQGSMVLMRRPGHTSKWSLQLFYRAKDGRYIDCGGSAAWLGHEPATHFLEIPL